MNRRIPLDLHEHRSYALRMRLDLALAAVAALSLFGTPAAAALAPMASVECGAPDMTTEDVRALPSAKRIAMVACFARAAAEELRTKLPIEVDASTSLTAVEADGATLRYTYSMQVDRSAVTEADRQGLLRAARISLCEGEDSRAVMSLGAVYDYVWLDRNKAVIATLSISGC